MSQGIILPSTGGGTPAASGAGELGFGLDQTDRIIPWAAVANSTTGGRTAAAINTLAATWTVFAEEMAIDDIQVYVSSAVATSTARFGIYDDSNGAPGTLLGEADSVLDSSTTGNKTITFTGVTAGPGRVWVAFVSQVALGAYRGGDVNGSMQVGGPAVSGTPSISSSTSRYPAVIHNGTVSGALPATWVAQAGGQKQHVWWIMNTSAP